MKRSLLDKLTRVDMTPRILTKNKSGGTSKEELAGLSPRSKQTPSKGLSMTPTNNNQMSEELLEIIKDDFIGCGVRQKSDGRIVTYFTPDSATELVEKLTKDISTLINSERAEAVKQFRKELVKLYPAFPNEQTLANIEFWKTLMDKAEEYLSNERGK